MGTGEFKPLFIVGTPRSGTTLLSTLLDRHSKICIPPETQYFTEFCNKVSRSQADEWSKTELINAAVTNRRICDLELSNQEVYAFFSKYEKSLPNLLRAILEAYTERYGKVIAGEKSPKHIEHVFEILNAFPNAKIICIIRDGRDVVKSLLKVGWAEPGNPRRLGLFCNEWSDDAALTSRLQSTFGEEIFLTVKYEDILAEPEKNLEKICRFIGVDFETNQLDFTEKSQVVPDWEKEWKSNSSLSLDMSRVGAWRKSKDLYQIWLMNWMMGEMLERYGYQDTDLTGCSLTTRCRIILLAIPYSRIMRPISLFGLKVFRKMWSWLRGFWT